MKRLTRSLSLILLMQICLMSAQAKNTPLWARYVTTAPDTTYNMVPLRCIQSFQQGEFVYSLSVANKKNGFAAPKTYLNKYNEKGVLVWGLVFLSGGSKFVVGRDIALDDTGNCYMAGAIVDTGFKGKSALYKIDTGGNVIWLRDSTADIKRGFNQVLYKDNLLYLKGDSGVAQFDLNGNAQWSHATPRQVNYMAIDNKGRAIVSFFREPGRLLSIAQYSRAGALNFSEDSVVYADKIATDQSNNIYLLETVNYTDLLVKLDSAGIFQWSTIDFPNIPFKVGSDGLLVDQNNDVIVVSQRDSLVKISPAGKRIWIKPHDLLYHQNYPVYITQNNLIAVTGTVRLSGVPKVAINLYNVNGNLAWQGTYNGFNPADMSFGYLGTYGLASKSSDTSVVVKFASPFNNTSVDFRGICVDSIWYDPFDPHFLNVRVFNGSASQLNYPSLRGVRAAGDTVFNPKNIVQFFAQLSNTYTTYRDTITVSGVSNFSKYTFLLSIGFRDTTAVIKLCNISVNVPEVNPGEMSLYPNPVTEQLTVSSNQLAVSRLTITDLTGRVVYMQPTTNSQQQTTINVSNFAKGVYFVTLTTANGKRVKKFVRE